MIADSLVYARPRQMGASRVTTLLLALGLVRDT